ncbi:MAG: hypothetical protein JWN77_3226 [Frankiales bacterium]|jgi:hypothetical protein|nr:hypothetical protein [Frankiales bacterium]
MSGVGTSTVVRELVRRGVRAYDADDAGLTEPRPDGSWGWRVDDVRALLDTAGDGLLVLAGCSPEQAQSRSTGWCC